MDWKNFTFDLRWKQKFASDCGLAVRGRCSCVFSDTFTFDKCCLHSHLFMYCGSLFCKPWSSLVKVHSVTFQSHSSCVVIVISDPINIYNVKYGSYSSWMMKYQIVSNRHMKNIVWLLTAHVLCVTESSYIIVVWAFAGLTYHIVENLRSQLKLYSMVANNFCMV